MIKGFLDDSCMNVCGECCGDNSLLHEAVRYLYY